MLDKENLVNKKTSTSLVIWVFLFITVVMSALDYINNKINSTSFTALLTLIACLVCITIVMTFKRDSWSRYRYVYLVALHALLFVSLVLILPISSYYILLWIPLAYSSYYYYHVKGLSISIIALLTTMSLGVTFQYESITSGVILDLLVWLIIVGGSATLVHLIVLGGRKEYSLLLNKITHAEYEHKRLTSLINNMNEAVISLDENGVINLYNATSLGLLNTNNNITNQQIQDVLKVYDDTKQEVDILAIIKQTNISQTIFNLNIHYGDKDIVAIEINICKTIHQSELNKEQGYILLMRDVTQQKNFDKEREEFISVVSHELRTPIAIAEANVSMAQLLVNKPDKKQSDIDSALEDAHKQVMFLSDMINDLTTLSKAENSNEAMELEAFDLTDVLNNQLKNFEQEAHRKGLYIKLRSVDNIRKVITSRLYLEEILQNVIGNAIKYTTQGGVSIDVKPDSRKTICLSVTDTGIGISKNDQERVFDKFFRSEDPLTRQTGGTGLGLYISSKLASRIGSQISISSAPGKGTTVSVVIPVVAVKEVDKKNVVKHEIENFLE